MNLPKLSHGDVVKVRKLTVHYDLGQGVNFAADFDAGKGRHFVLLLLGAHTVGDPEFPAEASLESLGWMKETTVGNYLKEVFAGYLGDAPDSDFQRGHLFGMLEAWKALGFLEDVPEYIAAKDLAEKAP